MRNVNEFRADTVNAMREHVNKVAALLDEYAKIEKQTKRTDYYTPQAIRDMQKDMDGLKKQMRDVMAAARQEGFQLCDRYADEARAAGALNAAELTDDVKLLNCGVTLSAADLEQMIERNAKNSTMLRLCAQYAKQHDITLNVVPHYVGADELRHAEDMRGSLDILFKEQSYDIIGSTFDRLFGVEG